MRQCLWPGIAAMVEVTALGRPLRFARITGKPLREPLPGAAPLSGTAGMNCAWPLRSAPTVRL